MLIVETVLEDRWEESFMYNRNRNKFALFLRVHSSEVLNMTTCGAIVECTLVTKK